MIRSFQQLSKLIFLPGYLVRFRGLFFAFPFEKMILIYTADFKFLGSEFLKKVWRAEGRSIPKPVLAGVVANL